MERTWWAPAEAVHDSLFPVSLQLLVQESLADLDNR
jgi:hypothetical protein